ncbi:MAG: hypothetical protein U0R49_05290 [Fimbriimonadales bacterium]
MLMKPEVRTTLRKTTLVTGCVISLIAFSSALAPRGSWRYVATPQHPTATNQQIKGVTALSPTDAWAVGRWFDPNVKIQTLHWDGTQWSFINPPATAHLGGTPDLDDVDHAPNGDVWAVGNVYTGYPTDNNPLVMRWRNGGWDYVDKVRFGNSEIYPYAERGGGADVVECISENDLWIAGWAAGKGMEATVRAMSAHWDGSSWTEFDVPVFGTRYNEIVSMSATGPNDIWAVGWYRDYAADYHSFVVHWDGNSWSHVSTPVEGMQGDSLNNVLAFAPDDAWIVGSVPAGGVILHWDGNQWSHYDDPSRLGRGFGYLAASAPNDIWTTGADNSFWHYDGMNWSFHSNPTVPGARFWWRSGGLAASGKNDVWSVGGWDDGVKNYNLTERFSLKPATNADAIIRKR